MFWGPAIYYIKQVPHSFLNEVGSACLGATVGPPGSLQSILRQAPLQEVEVMCKDILRPWHRLAQSLLFLGSLRRGSGDKEPVEQRLGSLRLMVECERMDQTKLPIPSTEKILQKRGTSQLSRRSLSLTVATCLTLFGNSQAVEDTGQLPSAVPCPGPVLEYCGALARKAKAFSLQTCSEVL